MTREEQIEAAKEIARLNPEWVWDTSNHALSDAKGNGALLYRDGTWAAARCGSPVLDVRRMVQRFASPTKALRALGFTLNERETP